MKRMVVGLAAVVGLGLVGCDSPGGNGGEPQGPGQVFEPGKDPVVTPGSGKGSYTPDEVCPMFAKMFCFEQAVCDLEETTMPSACLTAFEEICEVHIVRTLKESIGRGEATYDAVKAGKCFDNMKVGCEETVNPNEADCEAIVVGTVAVGQPCHTAQGCVPEAFCQPGEGGSCPGTCVAKAKAGEACGFGEGEADCGPGLECNGQDVCVAERVNQPVGGSCEWNDHCAAGLYCDYQSQTCKATVAAGGACTGGECVDGTFCKFGEAGGVCTAELAEGAACGSGDACQSGLACECPDGGFDCATEERTCKSYVPAVGSACDPADEWSCGGSSRYCRKSDSTCQPQPRVGEACGEALGADECLWGWCNPQTNLCEAYTMVDQACTTTAQCLPGLGCLSGKCTAPPVDCTSDLEL